MIGYFGPMAVPSVDIYCTYRCNMRCRHCFVGNYLRSARELRLESIVSFLEAAQRGWGTREATFLGGEPTLYTSIRPALERSLELGLHTRLVSNGSRPCELLIRDWDGPPLHFAFSLDGSETYHDRIRRRGSFADVMRCGQLAVSLGHSISGIVAIGEYNAQSLHDAIAALDQIGAEYVNIHYVSARGFARPEYVVTPSAWLAMWERLEAEPSHTIGTKIRFEKTFRLPYEPHHCALADRSQLMLVPDERVFSCAMLIDVPDGHQYVWSDGRLVENPSFPLHGTRGISPTGHCPASHLVDPAVPVAAEAIGRRVSCIYDKSEREGSRGRYPRSHAQEATR